MRNKDRATILPQFSNMVGCSINLSFSKKQHQHMTEPELHIFPTSSRSKHSKEVSYPIGAEALSQALIGVPQQEQITCSFYAGHPQYDDGKPQFYVLQVSYQKKARNFHHTKSALESGALDPHWSIAVFAVPRHLRGAIKLLLLEQALPDIIRPWLIANNHLTGQTGTTTLDVEYIRAEEIFKYNTRENIAPERV
jgi:hypothetical protein